MYIESGRMAKVSMFPSPLVRQSTLLRFSPTIFRRRETIYHSIVHFNDTWKGNMTFPSYELCNLQFVVLKELFIISTCDVDVELRSLIGSSADDRIECQK